MISKLSMNHLRYSRSSRRSRCKMRGKEIVSPKYFKISISQTPLPLRQKCTSHPTPLRRIWYTHPTWQTWSNCWTLFRGTSTIARSVPQNLKSPPTCQESYSVGTAYVSAAFVLRSNPRLYQRRTKGNMRQPANWPAWYASKYTFSRWPGTASLFAMRNLSKSEMKMDLSTSMAIKWSTGRKTLRERLSRGRWWITLLTSQPIW